MRADPHNPEVRERFLSDVADHEMSVLLDQGIYRHIQYREPGSSFYWFDLITTPGQLTVWGDMGCYVFSRLTDMFNFFGDSNRTLGGPINPSYWSEKLRSSSRQGVQNFSQKAYLQWLADNWEERKEEYGQMDRIRILNAMYEQLTDADSHEEIRDVLEEFDTRGHRFSDVWEHHFTDYDYHFLWCCNAIVWGIEQYREREQVAA